MSHVGCVNAPMQKKLADWIKKQDGLTYVRGDHCDLSVWCRGATDLLQTCYRPTTDHVPCARWSDGAHPMSRLLATMGRPHNIQQMEDSSDSWARSRRSSKPRRGRCRSHRSMSLVWRDRCNRSLPSMWIKAHRYVAPPLLHVDSDCDWDKNTWGRPKSLPPLMGTIFYIISHTIPLCIINPNDICNFHIS